MPGAWRPPPGCPRVEEELAPHRWHRQAVRKRRAEHRLPDPACLRHGWPLLLLCFGTAAPL
eukprot:11222376-Lingulodinium_polyedra.AAC.1